MIRNPEWFVVLFVFYHGSESEWVWAKSPALFVLELFRTTLVFTSVNVRFVDLWSRTEPNPGTLKFLQDHLLRSKSSEPETRSVCGQSWWAGLLVCTPCILVCFVVWSRHSINCNRSKNPIGQPWWCQWWCCAWNHSDECCCCTTRRSLV